MSNKFFHKGRDTVSQLITEATSPVGDTFGRIRTSDPNTIFLERADTDDDRQIAEATVNGGVRTNDFTEPSTIMTVPAVNGAAVVRVSRARMHYISGKSMLIVETGVLDPEPGTIKRVGYFSVDTSAPHNPTDGMYFEASDGVLNVVIRKNGVDTLKVPQSEWEIDKMDGTGVSGINLDTSLGQVFVVDFLWLGMGIVRFGFQVAGVVYYCHAAYHANVLAAPFVSSPALNVSYSIHSTGGAGSMKHFCSAAFIEGGNGNSEPGSLFSISNRNLSIPISGGGTITEMVALRHRADRPSRYITTETINALTFSNTQFRIIACINPTYTAAQLGTWVNVGNGSTLQYRTYVPPGNQPGNNISNPQQQLASIYASSDGDIGQLTTDEGLLNFGKAINGTSDLLVLAVQNLTGNNQNYVGTITWKEYF